MERIPISDNYGTEAFEEMLKEATLKMVKKIKLESAETEGDFVKTKAEMDESTYLVSLNVEKDYAPLRSKNSNARIAKTKITNKKKQEKDISSEESINSEEFLKSKNRKSSYGNEDVPNKSTRKDRSLSKKRIRDNESNKKKFGDSRRSKNDNDLDDFTEKRQNNTGRTKYSKHFSHDKSKEKKSINYQENIGNVKPQTSPAKRFVKEKSKRKGNNFKGKMGNKKGQIKSANVFGKGKQKRNNFRNKN